MLFDTFGGRMCQEKSQDLAYYFDCTTKQKSCLHFNNNLTIIQDF